MDWMLMPLRRYADFSGRSRRKEYWLYQLFLILVTFALGILMVVAGGFTGVLDPAGGNPVSAAVWVLVAVFGLLVLAVIIPSLAVIVRRLHDQDKSGWFILIQFVPYVGGIVMLVFMCIEGTRGENRYGPDPKGENIADVFA